MKIIKIVPAIREISASSSPLDRYLDECRTQIAVMRLCGINTSIVAPLQELINSLSKLAKDQPDEIS
jgi:hypothetical protein